MRVTVLRRLRNTALGAATFIFPLMCYSLSRRWHIGMSSLHKKVMISKAKKILLKIQQFMVHKEIVVIIAL